MAKGLTLIELLLVVGIVALLAAIVIVAMNPTQRFSEVRDRQRQQDTEVILNAVLQYAVDGGDLAVLPFEATEICKSTAEDCGNLVDLSDVTSAYLGRIPLDPRGASTEGTGYTISRDEEDMITVGAPHTEQVGMTIEISR
jgi:prepilin-type N-terminal cleavage/methylation domain-containing protein